MDLSKLKELMELLEKSELHKMTLKEKDGLEIHLEKPKPEVVAAHTLAAAAPAVHAPQPAMPAAAEPALQEPAGEFITSPMVGTFYTASSPDNPPFVKSGDRVDADTVVCIIEAMKVMNEVKAGKAGVVKEVLIDNANPVEFGTKLIRIE